MRSIQVCGAGRAGDGTNTNISMLGQVLKDLGAWAFVWREEVYSNIQTRDTAFGLRAADVPVYGPDDEFDILEAFDQGAFVDWTGEGRVPPLARLRKGGIVLYDSSPRLEYPNAGHEVRPEQVEAELKAREARLFGLPMGRMAKEQFGNYIVRGTIALGVLAHMLGLPEEAFARRFVRIFGEGSDLFRLNLEAFRAGLEYARAEGWELPDLRLPLTPREDDERQLLLGNEAVALGSIVAGCRFYAGYPITPASEVLEYMAEKLPSVGGVVVQADSEMAAAHHVIGGSVAGARAMTATSGPGFSLMQEAISAAGMTETPVVIVVSQRGGPATGLPTKVGQEDLNETVFGGHGDFARIVLAPTEPEDAFYMMEKAFNLADRYQCPVFVIYDQMFAQSTYTTPPLNPSRFTIDRGKVVAAPANGHNGRYRRYALTEDGISPRAFPGMPGIHTIYVNTNEHTEEGYITEEMVVRKAMVEKRVVKRMQLIVRDRDLPSPVVHGPADAPIGFIGYGSVYGPVLEAVQRLAEKGQKAKFMALRTIWPFPGREVRRFVDSCRVVYVVEYSATAQLKGLVQREATGPMPRKLRSVLRYDGRPMTPGYVLQSL
ncbi:2-oxoglutarate oxidoreductase subunit KorA [bacterium HR24]|nr:2-oxoglutarate oxidoreductase subunit KorA [bacterium HR24]